MDDQTRREVQKMIQEALDSRQQENQFQVTQIPAHTHNGVDSSLVTAPGMQIGPYQFSGEGNLDVAMPQLAQGDNSNVGMVISAANGQPILKLNDNAFITRFNKAFAAASNMATGLNAGYLVTGVLSAASGTADTVTITNAAALTPGSYIMFTGQNAILAAAGLSDSVVYKPVTPGVSPTQLLDENNQLVNIAGTATGSWVQVTPGFGTDWFQMYCQFDPNANVYWSTDTNTTAGNRTGTLELPNTDFLLIKRSNGGVIIRIASTGSQMQGLIDTYEPIALRSTVTGATGRSAGLLEGQVFFDNTLKTIVFSATGPGVTGWYSVNATLVTGPNYPA